MDLILLPFLILLLYLLCLTLNLNNFYYNKVFLSYLRNTLLLILLQYLCPHILVVLQIILYLHYLNNSSHIYLLFHLIMPFHKILFYSLQKINPLFLLYLQLLNLLHSLKLHILHYLVVLLLHSLQLLFLNPLLLFLNLPKSHPLKLFLSSHILKSTILTIMTLLLPLAYFINTMPYQRLMEILPSIRG